MSCSCRGVRPHPLRLVDLRSLPVSPDVATLWTAIAAVGGAVASGAVTAVVTYKVTRRQVTSAEGTATEQRTHESNLAIEQRRQERSLAAYTSVMRHVGFLDSCSRVEAERYPLQDRSSATGTPT